jgi:hypothetical protein
VALMLAIVTSIGVRYSDPYDISIECRQVPEVRVSEQRRVMVEVGIRGGSAGLGTEAL